MIMRVILLNAMTVYEARLPLNSFVLPCVKIRSALEARIRSQVKPHLGYDNTVRFAIHEDVR